MRRPEGGPTVRRIAADRLRVRTRSRRRADLSPANERERDEYLELAQRAGPTSRTTGSARCARRPGGRARGKAGSRASWSLARQPRAGAARRRGSTRRSTPGVEPGDVQRAAARRRPVRRAARALRGASRPTTRPARAFDPEPHEAISTRRRPRRRRSGWSSRRSRRATASTARYCGPARVVVSE